MRIAPIIGEIHNCAQPKRTPDGNGVNYFRGQFSRFSRVRIANFEQARARAQCYQPKEAVRKHLAAGIAEFRAMLETKHRKR